MRRREFVAALGGAAAWPLTAGAQQPERVRRIGVVLQGGPYYVFVQGMRDALKTGGMEDGKQIMLVVRDAKGDPAAAAAAVRELERDGVHLIVAVTTAVARSRP